MNCTACTCSFFGPLLLFHNMFVHVCMCVCVCAPGWSPTPPQSGVRVLTITGCKICLTIPLILYTDLSYYLYYKTRPLNNCSIILSSLNMHLLWTCLKYMELHSQSISSDCLYPKCYIYLLSLYTYNNYYGHTIILLWSIWKIKIATTHCYYYCRLGQTL